MIPAPELDLDTQQLIDEVRPLIQQYLSAREGLRRLGILRTNRDLQADYAEWFTSRVLSIQLADNATQKDYDAIDKQGLTYQIKARTVTNTNQPTSFDMSGDAKFDYLVGVFFSTDLNPLLIIRVPYKALRALGIQTQTTFRFRWNTESSAHPSVEVVWAR